jgi:hypothetical protein
MKKVVIFIMGLMIFASVNVKIFADYIQEADTEVRLIMSRDTSLSRPELDQVVEYEGHRFSEYCESLCCSCLTPIAKLLNLLIRAARRGQDFEAPVRLAVAADSDG